MKRATWGLAFLWTLTWCASASARPDTLPSAAAPYKPSRNPDSGQRRSPQGNPLQEKKESKPGIDHHELRRWVFRIELTGGALSRVLCTVHAPNGMSDTIIWDPEDKLPAVRFARLPWDDNDVKWGELDPSSLPATLHCRAEPKTIGAHSDTSYVVQYDAAPAASEGITPECPDQVIATKAVTLTPRLVGAAPDATPPAGIRVTLSDASCEETDLVRRGNMRFAGATRLRSLDPTTAFSDLFTALAAVALDRASEAGKGYASQRVTEFCDAVTKKSGSETRKDTPFSKLLDAAEWPNEANLFPHSCSLFETVRLDELLSEEGAVRKAIIADITALAASMAAVPFRSAFCAKSKEAGTDLVCYSDLPTVVEAMGSLVLGAAAGGAPTTERDAQALLLSLARVGFSGDKVKAKNRLHMSLETLELGMAVLVECLEDGECPSDDLERRLLLELEYAGKSSAIRAWPELPALLGRAANVLRPAPGVRPKQVIADSADIVLDVMVQLQRDCSSEDDLDDITERADAKRQRELAFAMLPVLRMVTATLRGENVTSLLASFAEVFDDQTNGDHCGDSSECRIAWKSSQMKRAFKVMTAVATYGSSYQNAEAGEDPEEIAKLRLEERRKAVESLVDALTDRSDRGGEQIISLGANVALGAEYHVPLGESSDGDRRGGYVNRLPLSLRTGLAIQQLPEKDHVLGWHVGVVLLDLAQYAVIKGTGNDSETVTAPTPEPLTALRIGAEAGALVGKPGFPVLLSAHFSYAPRIRFGDGKARPELIFGLGAGIYVPFIDFY